MVSAAAVRRALTAAALLLACAALLGTPSAPARGRSRHNERSHPHPQDDEPVTGCGVPVAGPIDVVRATRRPQFEKIPFSTSDPTAPHVLRIDNGGASDQWWPVTRAVVFLNHHILLGPNRFKRFVQTIEEAIEVESENELFLGVAGKPRSGFTLEVFAIDAQPPSIIEVFPPDGSIVSEPQVALVIDVDDSLSDVARVTCSDIEATPGDGDFACTVALLEGSNLIEIAAFDACDNESRIDVEIEFDPPPVVSIDSPEDGDVFVQGPVEVTGTVDDPAAEVTVNGVLATGAPTFTASVPVHKGDNTLVALARDAVGGEGSDSVQITVLADPLGPTVSITSPAPNFLLGGPRSSPPSPTPVPVRGRIRVDGGSGAGNAPGVLVNGLAAAVQLSGSPGPLCGPLGLCWWDFGATLALTKADNPQLIEAVGTDGSGRTDVDSVSGDVDECVSFEPDPNVASDGLAVVGASSKQGNRCHEIDGCSSNVQDPTFGKLGRSSTAFGKDTRAEEKAPHGLAPKDDLPCNHHDVCYQTCGSVKVTCDDAMYTRMVQVCRRAYPESTCPYLPNLLKCDAWRRERDNCYRWARTYRIGLASPPAQSRFDLRQGQYCWPSP